jgi:hypothetical protein
MWASRSLIRRQLRRFTVPSARSRSIYDQRLWVTLCHEPAEIRGFEVLHAGAGSELSQPAPVFRAIVERCRRGERNSVLFEAIDTMIERWGAEVTARFFAHLLSAATRRWCDCLLVGAVGAASSRLAAHYQGDHPMRLGGGGRAVADRQG